MFYLNQIPNCKIVLMGKGRNFLICTLRAFFETAMLPRILMILDYAIDLAVIDEGVFNEPKFKKNTKWFTSFLSILSFLKLHPFL